MLKFSMKTRRVFWLFGVLAIFCFSQIAVAQSGRRTKKGVVPQPQPAPVESRSTEAESDIEEDKTPVRITSLMVVGEVQHNFLVYNSSEMDAALKELIRTLKDAAKSAPQLIKGGKMKYEEAKAQAKKETDVFVLWLGFAAKDDGYGNMYIDSIQYAVLKPKTARQLTRGEIKPGQTSTITSGGVLKLPTGRRRTSSLLEMKLGAREIAAILVRGGWLD